MANTIKHVGKYGEKKAVVVFREVPDEPQYALVVLTDALEGRTHDELMNVVEGPEAQAAGSLADVLNRRQFSDGGNMLTALHYGKKLTKVLTENVDLTPTPGQRVKLSEVNAEIRKLGQPLPKTDPRSQDQPWIERQADPKPVDQQEQTSAHEQQDDQASVAQSLYAQAMLMKQDAESLVKEAEAKLAEAVKLDPKLAPAKPKRKSTPRKKSAVKGQGATRAKKPATTTSKSPAEPDK